jgi:hypothetical protein
VIVAERKGVVGIEPAQVEVAPVSAFPDLDHLLDHKQECFLQFLKECVILALYYIWNKIRIGTT